jgi:hypothetical protein
MKEKQAAAQCRRQAPGVKFVTALMLGLALSLSSLPGGAPAQAAEITFRCVNPASGASFDLKIDEARQTADSFAAEITPTRVIWRDIVHRGSYELDRRSGQLTFRNASSTGGYILSYQCHPN